MYLLQFDADLKGFEWRRVQIGCTGPRAFHSAEYLPKLDSVAIVGGICCDEGGATIRHKLGVLLVNTTTWAWKQYELSSDIHLSSTKLLKVAENKLLYLGGYTSKNPSITPGENEKSCFWGTMTFVKETAKSPLKASLEGKASEQLGAFACGNAIIVGKEILISCGTEPLWGVLTATLPLAQACDLPACCIDSRSSDLSDRWIKYVQQNFDKLHSMSFYFSKNCCSDATGSARGGCILFVLDLMKVTQYMANTFVNGRIAGTMSKRSRKPL